MIDFSFDGRLLADSINSLLLIFSDSPIQYTCYADGSIILRNPRTELYTIYSYAESNGAVCPTMYIDGGKKLMVYDCDVVSIDSFYYHF